MSKYTLKPRDYDTSSGIATRTYLYNVTVVRLPWWRRLLRRMKP